MTKQKANLPTHRRFVLETTTANKATSCYVKTKGIPLLSLSVSSPESESGHHTRKRERRSREETWRCRGAARIANDVGRAARPVVLEPRFSFSVANARRGVGLNDLEKRTGQSDARFTPVARRAWVIHRESNSTANRILS